MTKLFERAVEAASKLPDTEQDALATLMLAELDSERVWSDLFGVSADKILRLANAARAEF